MNNKLEALEYISFEAEVYWKHYGRIWTRLNHVRSLGSIPKAGLYVIAAVALITRRQV